MRFVILTQYYPPEIGAPQVRLSAVARELVALGHDVEVVTALPNHPTGRIHPQYKGRFYCKELAEGIPVHRVWLYASTGAGLRRLINYISFMVMSFFALLKCARPDVLFVESPPLFLSIPGFLFSRLWKAKLIFNVADLWPDSVRDLGLIKNRLILRFAESLEMWSYRVASYVTAVTDGIRTTLTVDKQVPPGKVLFLPNGVDTELFRPQSYNYELARPLDLEGRKVFLYAGTLGYAQGLETVLEAASLLSDRPDICFVFIGDGSDKQSLVASAKQKGLTNVRFLDPAPPHAVAELYTISVAGLAVLRNIPLFEGARPSKVFPAMACGVPIVYSGAGEGARLVTLANAGIAVPPEQPAKLADAVMYLADHPEAAAPLGAAGRQYVESNLSWNQLVGRWVQHINSRG